MFSISHDYLSKNNVYVERMFYDFGAFDLILQYSRKHFVA